MKDYRMMLRLEPMEVPEHLTELYERQEVSKLDLLEAKQGRQLDRWSEDLDWMVEATNGGRPALEKFIEHRLKLAKAQAEYEAPIKAAEEARRKEKYEREHTCPVCSSFDTNSSQYQPCKHCRLIIDWFNAANQSRLDAVHHWLNTAS